MIILWWLFIASRSPFDYIGLYNDGAKKEGVPFSPDIDGFTDEPVVQCDAQVVENTFIDDSK